MRFTVLLVICFCLFGFSASAQWYRIDLKLKKPPVRYPQLAQAVDHSVSRIHFTELSKLKIQVPHFERSEFSIEAAEAVIMKSAKHHMRFREYNDASYEFSELADLYVQQNRFSEAKWYLLQSNTISRNQSDDKHTISNLIGLATIKAELGDFTQAQQDLTEAREMAMIRGYRDDLLQIGKKMLYIKQNRLSSPRPELRYAEALGTTSKAE